MPITHAKVSGLGDGGDAAQVQPFDWNDDHVGSESLHGPIPPINDAKWGLSPIGGYPSGGTFTLSWGGDTTTPLAFNATAQDVIDALSLLPSVNYGIGQAYGENSSYPWYAAQDFAWMYQLGGQPQPLPTVDASLLTGNGGAEVLLMEEGQHTSAPLGTWYVDDSAHLAWISIGPGLDTWHLVPDVAGTAAALSAAIGVASSEESSNRNAAIAAAVASGPFLSPLGLAIIAALPVSYWPLTEKAGTHAFDVMDAGRHVSFGGAISMLGPHGGYLLNGGSGGCPADDNMPHGTGVYSIEASYKTDDTTAIDMGIVAWGTLDNLQGAGIGVLVGPQISLAWNSDDFRVDVATAEDGNWHHLVGVWDGTHRKLYFDGVQVGGDNTPTGTPDLIGDGGNIILFTSFGGDTFHGNIRDVAIYDRVLSATEIADHAAAMNTSGVSAHVADGSTVDQLRDALIAAGLMAAS